MTSQHRKILNITDELFSRYDNSESDKRIAIYYRNEIWTYRRLIDEINRVGNTLKDLGIEKENRILMISYDSPYFISTFYGAVKIGAIPVPVNTYLKPEEYLFFLEDTEAKVLVVEPEIWNKLSQSIKNKTTKLKHVIILPGMYNMMEKIESTQYIPQSSYTELVSKASVKLEAEKTSPNDMAFWLYTSGTTGHPKAALHLHKDILVVLNTFVKNILKITERDRLFSASKLFFAYGLGNGSYFAFGNGASVILMPERVEPKRVLETIHKYKPTIFFGVPTLYNAMLQVEEWKNYDLSSLRFCVSAGEPLPPAIFNRWKERYGIEIVDGIGSTEALHIYISNIPGNCKAGSSGKVVPGYEVKIVDENGNEVPPKTVGDLYVKGDSIAMFYWRDYEATRRNMVGFWFRTGDKFFRDEDGYYYYVGRSDDMIKTSGLWVSPIEVEAVLLSHPAILEAAVVGLPDEVGLIKVVAFVTLKQGYSPSEELANNIKDYLKEKLDHYKVPKEIRFVNEIPKTATGKIQRYKFRLGEVK
ncbi:benzoate-CoA ligase family protein [Saccharolobus solfataricus]|uniref:Acetyl-CoA synthetase (Acetate-CoA ligase) (AcsA-1) n=2 Tax=Saccharolobus solfataricus TaxID=2287 RepID=Q97YK9_SACS2|nr:benzoate-CoA ligase family protein [Saccharolobus solfataricus]AAK41550.1 Acetyl-CoA synthetase (acetate-CoA ligase) (acsA-1) [Saccharolobus solfataricus P2]QPG48980.1 benzoate-CoA ligase family protein [Saccharolobus solfataricus]SAI84983.1 4-hydroxybenzoate-CoA ligase [Saccharolobus solfataricus]